jgi:enoyl-CoA hydratase
MKQQLPEFEHLLLERDESIVWLTLNRPERLNAISRQMLADFRIALDHLAEDDARVLVIRGAGRAFSSGFDITPRPPGEVVEEPDIVDDYLRLRRQAELFLSVWDFPKPVIAAVHGYCLGGPTQLVSCCDLTVVADDAIIGFPEIPLGGGYISPFWVPLVGVKRAKQMSFEPGSQISGITASEWGWANYSVPAEALMTTVRDQALRIARVPASTLLMKKMSLNRVADIQGFRATAVLGAETDAVLHASAAVQDLRDSVRELGLKAAIQKFRNDPPL